MSWLLRLLPIFLAACGGGGGSSLRSTIVNAAVTIEQAVSQSDPSSSSTLNYTVTFDADVTGLSASHFTVAGASGAAVSSVTGSGSTYTVGVSGMSADGNVSLSLPAGVLGIGTGVNQASTSTDNSVTWYETMKRVNISSSGTQSNGGSIGDSTLSGDGRYVVFYTAASNLVSGDTNALEDIFRYDRTTGTIERVSVSTAGAQSDGASYAPSISPDGRFIAFESNATTLVAGDTNALRDIFLRDMTLGTTVRVSLTNAGAQSAGGISTNAAVSSDGRYVAFRSVATNLVAGDTNGNDDIFVRDTTLNTTTRISVSTAGVQNTTGGAGIGNSTNPVMTPDGRYVAYYSYGRDMDPADTNLTADIYVRDTTLNTTTRVSLSTAGVEGNGACDMVAISSNGRYVAWQSAATNHVAGDTNGVADIFYRDTQTNTTTRVSVATDGSQGNGASTHPVISADGRYVGWVSAATNLVTGDTNGVIDVFVRDTQTNTTTRMNVSSAGVQANGATSLWSIGFSGDGRYIAFDSAASNLVTGDTNGASDVFVRYNP